MMGWVSASGRTSISMGQLVRERRCGVVAVTLGGCAGVVRGGSGQAGGGGVVVGSTVLSVRPGVHCAGFCGQP